MPPPPLFTTSWSFCWFSFSFLNFFCSPCRVHGIRYIISSASCMHGTLILLASLVLFWSVYIERMHCIPRFFFHTATDFPRVFFLVMDHDDVKVFIKLNTLHCSTRDGWLVARKKGVCVTGGGGRV